MNLDHDFERFVDARIDAQLRGPKTWSDLLYSLPSVYPGIVFDAARRLRLDHMISHCSSANGHSIYESTASRLWAAGLLATPHPLDASWWFTNPTLDVLTDHLLELTSPGDRILLLGTPTLFHTLRTHIDQREILLVDRHTSGNQRKLFANSITIDILRKQPAFSRPSRVVLADPPWYIPETQAFLLMARRNAAKGAKVLLAVPPLGTRPGIRHEWDQLVLWARGIGLRLVDYRPEKLTYLSPPFEQNALRSGGVPPCPLDWRRGDLAVFTCDDVNSFPAPPPRMFGNDAWQEIVIGNVSLRTRQRLPFSWDDPGLQEIIPGDVLPSVSRRDPRLESVNVWTSGNRVFNCGGVSTFSLIAKAIAMHECPVVYITKKLGLRLGSKQICSIHDATMRLTELIDIEELELSHWKRQTNAELVRPSSSSTGRTTE